MRQVDQRNLVKTAKLNGKVIETDEIGLSPDGKTLTITKHIPGHDKPIVIGIRSQVSGKGLGMMLDSS